MKSSIDRLISGVVGGILFLVAPLIMFGIGSLVIWDFSIFSENIVISVTLGMFIIGFGCEIIGYEKEDKTEMGDKK